MYRKRSHLAQSDIAFLLGMSEYSNIAHYEKGRRVPTTELLLLYRILFNAPVECLLESLNSRTSQEFVERLRLLLEKAQEWPDTPRNAGRKAFLQQTLSRLA